MQLTSPWTRLLAIVATSVVLTVCAVNADPVKPIPVDLRVGGDDGLTLRLRDALEGAFRSSPDFTLKGQGTLVLSIPTNVGWKKRFGRTRVLYTVKFTSINGQNLGSRSGSCWESALQKCAAQIVTEARTAARKLR